MKTQYIIQAFRNAASPRARLAAWQNLTLAHRRRLMARTYRPASLTDARRQCIAAMGPELSAPESAKVFLWGESEVEHEWEGRTFLNHRGWYSMDEMIGATIETCAVRLKRFPRLLFYAVRDNDSGSLRVMLEDWEEIAGGEAEDCARSLIRSYDSATEREAEECREYFERDQLEQEMEGNRETLARLRGNIRALVRDIRALCPAVLEYPAAAAALHSSLVGMLRERETLISRNREITAAL